MKRETCVYDLGNYNLKGKDNFVCRNCYIESEENFDIEIEGVRYLFGLEEEFDEQKRKTDRDLIPSLLYCLNQQYKVKELEVNLLLGVPNDEVEAKEIMQNKLIDKTFKYKDNKGNEYTVHVADVEVYREGVASWYTISATARKQEDIVLFDIGGGTVNVIRSENGKLTIDKFTLKDLGTIKLFSDFARVHTQLAGKRVYFAHNIRKAIEKKSIDSKSTPYKDITLEQANIIINRTLKTIPNLFDYSIYLGGGGATLFDDSFKKIIEKHNANTKVKTLNNPISANLEGAIKIAGAIKKWK